MYLHILSSKGSFRVRWTRCSLPCERVSPDRVHMHILKFMHTHFPNIQGSRQAISSADLQTALTFCEEVKKCSQIPLHTLTMHVLSNLYPGSFSGLRQEPLHNTNAGKKKFKRIIWQSKKVSIKPVAKTYPIKTYFFWLCFLLFNVKYYWLNKTQIVKQVPAGCNI